MAELSLQKVSEDGMQISYQAAEAGGDEAPNDGLVILAIKNGDSEDHTVTVATQVSEFESSIYGDAYKNNAELTVPAGATGYMGPFKPAAYNVDGSIQISYDAVNSVEIAALKIQDVKRT